ncbi:TPA: NADH-quinone oxidoreductase subunit B, partial [Campylobacter jejuni]|nr:NADH-quinone oxidoreductase subunit B [Campylobacter jejuni]
ESFQFALMILQKKIRKEKASRKIAPKRLI